MPPLLGNWELAEARAFDEARRPMPSPFGPQPMGVVRFEAERMAVVVADGRPDLPPGLPPRAFVSYTGRYEFNGDRLVTHVDGASSPDGFADQVRQITFQGPDRMVVVPLSRVLDRNSGLELTWKRIG
jgi:Lipocalin-like domain